MKTALIFLNGQRPCDSLLKTIDFDSKLIVCADGALDYLINYVVPNVLVGDFDSLRLQDYELPDSVEIFKLSKDKDYTDGFIAVETAINAGATKLEIYGAFGAREDHAYNNYTLLSFALIHQVDAVLKGDKFDVFITQNTFSAEIVSDKTISIVPFGDRAHILSTRGLKFPANNLVYDRLNPIGCVEGISNEAIGGAVEINIKSGTVLIFIEK